MEADLGGPAMEGLLQDLRYALRILRRSPGFTTVAVVTLALGIGASSAIFSIVHAVVLQPLPYPEPERLVQLWMRFTGIGIPNDQNWVSAPELLDLQRNRSLSAIAAISSSSFNAVFGGAPERIEAAVVSPSLFQLLGVRPQAGRVFLPEEGTAGRDRVVLLGDGIWRRRFGADPGVVGRKLILSGESYVVTGVLPRGFQFPSDAEIWAPLAFAPADLTPDNRGSHGLEVVARIAPRLTLAQARADLDAVSRRIVAEHPEYPYKTYNFKVLAVPLLDQQIGEVRTALWVLLGAVGFVLLIACANVANLLLARAAGREREIAVRQALGVGRRRLLRLLLTESALLGLGGGAAGLALAVAALRVLVAASAGNVPRIHEVRLDVPVLLFTVLVSLATGLLFGLAPAVAMFRADTHAALKAGGRGASAGAASQRLRGALVAAEVALALALLAGSGLLIRSFLRLQEVDGGFKPAGVLTLRISLPEQRYPKAEQARAFYRDLLERVRKLPGVDAAGAANGLPLGGTGWSGTVTIDTRAVPPADTTPEADQRPVTPGYFEALHVPLLRGRTFDERDNQTAARVCVIDETLAKTYWPHDDAIGKRIHTGAASGGGQVPWMTVVGVVRHVRYRTLESPSRVELYWPYVQTPFRVGTLSLAIHSSLPPLGLVAAVRRELRAVDPEQAAYRVRTMDELVADSVARRRLSTTLLAVFAGVALLLAAVGIYGVMSYAVAQRSHEMGIRMALGARGGQVVAMVLGRGLSLTAAGLAVGLAAALVLTRLLKTLLFAVSSYDPLTFVTVAALLVLVAAAASFVPAHRATAVDPVNALRRE
jgi:putative ABC transport system permease protein